LFRWQLLQSIPVAHTVVSQSFRVTNFPGAKSDFMR